MARRKNKVEEPQPQVEENTIIGENGERFQRPDPVVPQENAVAPDAPVYENLPKNE